MSAETAGPRAGSNPDRAGPDQAEATTVVVVGAGPAGSAAAIELGRAGVDTVVIDKATFPRDKCCGDGLTTAALRQLDALGLAPAKIPSWQPVSAVQITTPAGRPIRYRLGVDRPGLFAATATRVELDQALVELATDLVDVRPGVGLEDIVVGDRRVRVKTSAGPIDADYVVAADGMWSPTRKALGLAPPRYRGEWHGLRQYFVDVGPAAASDLFVWFEPDLLPGYLWSFPLAGRRANVGFGILRSGPGSQPVGDMASRWAELLTRPHIAEVLGADARPEASVRAWPIPARVERMPLAARRVLFAGDAAAAADPLTGEGIGQALQTGRAAARAIAEGGAAGAAGVEDRYRDDVGANLAVDMRFAGRLSAMMSDRWVAEAALLTTSATAWTRDNFARWLFEDYPRAILGTPGRWPAARRQVGGGYRDERAPSGSAHHSQGAEERR